MSGAAIAVAGLNALAALLGGWCWFRGQHTAHSAVRIFWILLRVGQGAAILYALAAGLLAATGARPDEQLFYLYALLPLAVAFVAEQLRVASAQTILDQRGLPDAAAVGQLSDSEQHALVAAIVHRELGTMALSSLVVAFLALRAAATAHGL